MLDPKFCLRASRLLLLFAWCALMCALPSAARAQKSGSNDKKKDGGPEVINKTLTGPSGWPINFTYFNSTAGKDSPVLILLHDNPGNQLIWEKSAEDLRKNGYAVVTVDLRKHGRSVPEGGEAGRLTATDYKLMALEDLEIVKNFLVNEHNEQQLNIRKTGLVAMGMSAPVALQFAATDWLKKPHPDGPTLASRTPRGQDVRAIALISPESSVAGVPTTKPLKLLQTPAFGVAILLYAGVADNDIKRRVERMYRQVASQPENKKRMYLVARNMNANGTVLLSDRFRPQTTELLLRFFSDHLAALEDPWRTRKSKLQD